MAMVLDTAGNFGALAHASWKGTMTEKLRLQITSATVGVSIWYCGGLSRDCRGGQASRELKVFRSHSDGADGREDGVGRLRRGPAELHGGGAVAQATIGRGFRVSTPSALRAVQ
jgi:hypothetical protein